MDRVGYSAEQRQEGSGAGAVAGIKIEHKNESCSGAINFRESTAEKYPLPKLQICGSATDPVAHSAYQRLAGAVHERWGRNVSVEQDNPVAAASVLFFGPGLYDALGHEKAQALMRESLVFGYGIANGVSAEAPRQDVAALAARAMSNSGFGFALGALEHLNPPAATCVGLTGMAAWANHEFGPDSAERNANVNRLFQDVWRDTSNRRLASNAAKADCLLGKDAFDTAFDFASGSIAFAPGRATGAELPIPQISSVFKNAARNLVPHIDFGVSGIRLQPTGARLHDHVVLGGIRLQPAGGVLHDNVVFSKTTNSLASTGRTLPERIAKLTDTDKKEVETKIEELKSEDASGNKVLQLNAIITAFETATNLRPSMAVLFSRGMDADKLSVYRKAIELPSIMHNLAELSANEIKSLSLTLKKNLSALELAVKSGDGAEIEAATKQLRNFSDAIAMAHESTPETRLLPPRIWTYSLRQVESEFVYNPTRGRLFQGVLKLAKELKEAGCQNLYLNGSFCTGKPFPNDFDATWEPQGVDLEKLSSELKGPWRSTPARVAKYGGDIFIRDPKTTGHDHVEQWQKDLRTGAKKGLIRIDLRSEQF